MIILLIIATILIMAYFIGFNGVILIAFTAVQLAVSFIHLIIINTIRFTGYFVLRLIRMGKTT